MSFFRKKQRGGSLAARVREEFGVTAPVAETAPVQRCVRAWQGCPDWLDGQENIVTVNFAAAVCAELARLAVLGAGLTVSGGDRAALLQEQARRFLPRLRDWVEAACAWGAVMLKPNGQGVDMLTPDQFLITAADGDDIAGCVFEDGLWDAERQRYYTRLEYHRFLPGGDYAVSNRCFVGASRQDWGKPVPLEATPWAGLCRDTLAHGLRRPLFALLRTPGQRAEPIFAGAMRELQDLDVAYSRMAEEIADSRRISLIDDRLTDCPGRGQVRLPRFARRVFGAGAQEYYQDIDPALHTAERLAGINALLGQIGFKCGFSNGYFVFNERSGLLTATQVEADDRRTVQLVKDVRERLQTALEGLLYALDKTADAYGEPGSGESYEAAFDFGDVTYNREEDRARWYGYVADGRIPFWYYLTRFEGFSRQQALALSEGDNASVADAP